MLKKAMVTAAVAASVVGVSAAPQAFAVGDDPDTTFADGGGARPAFGDRVTGGDLSPRAVSVRGSLDRLRVGLPARADAGSPVGLPAPVGLRDAGVPSSTGGQRRAEDSIRAEGDESPSHRVGDIPDLSGNGAGDG